MLYLKGELGTRKGEDGVRFYISKVAIFGVSNFLLLFIGLVNRDGDVVIGKREQDDIREEG
jgi:hypothetical protein